MAVDDIAFFHDLQTVCEHRVAFRWKTGNDIRADGNVRSRRFQPLHKIDRLCPAVPPLHPLQDHVVARLQRQMDMRHHAVMLRDQIEQAVVHLDPVEGRQAQPGQIGHGAQNALDQAAEPRTAGQVRAIAGHVHTGQHDFAEAFTHQRLGALDDGARRHRATVAAAEGDDAKGTAMIAAILHFQKGPGAVGKAAGEMRRSLTHLHDVGHADFRLVRRRRVQRGIRLFAIADHARHFGHGGEAFRLHLRGAAGHHDARIGPPLMGLPDQLARAAHGFVGHRAAVHHDQIVARAQRRGNRIAFGNVEAAAERNGLAHPKRFQSVRPSNT